MSRLLRDVSSAGSIQRGPLWSGALAWLCTQTSASFPEAPGHPGMPRELFQGDCPQVPTPKSRIGTCHSGTVDPCFFQCVHIEPVLLIILVWITIPMGMFNVLGSINGYITALDLFVFIF